MLQKLLFILLTVMMLTIAGATTTMAGPGNGDGDGICIGTGGGDGDGDRDRDRARDGSCMDDEVFSSSAKTDLTTDEIDMILFMREEEKVARDSYIVLGDKWPEMMIFKHIAVSEQKHMDAMKELIEKYNLTDPVLPGYGDFSDPELQTLFDDLMLVGLTTKMNGLKVGAAIEETDIEDIQYAIEKTDQLHIISTYESLMCGSRNHLRAFVRQIENNTGTPYEPQVLGEDNVLFWESFLLYEDFSALAHSDMERDCGGNKKGHDDS